MGIFSVHAFFESTGPVGGVLWAQVHGFGVRVSPHAPVTPRLYVVFAAAFCLGVLVACSFLAWVFFEKPYKAIISEEGVSRIKYLEDPEVLPTPSLTLLPLEMAGKSWWGKWST